MAISMACPYFYPLERLGLADVWPHPDRLPLGDGFAGACRADPGAEFHPTPEMLRDCCNLGYARGHCPRFVRNGSPDAIRFTISADDQRMIRVDYAYEQNHRPGCCGSLEYDRQAAVFRSPPEDAILLRQVETYIESYRRRKLEIAIQP